MPILSAGEPLIFANQWAFCVTQIGDPWRCDIARKPVTAVTETGNEVARAFAIEAARLCADTRCHQVVVLDMRALSPVCDYFVIASGTSKRQMHTVADDLAELGDEKNYTPYHGSGRESDQWVLIDFVHVVVHVFNDESRRFYDLENLWGDAPKVEWERPK